MHVENTKYIHSLHTLYTYIHFKIQNKDETHEIEILRFSFAI